MEFSRQEPPVLGTPPNCPKIRTWRFAEKTLPEKKYFLETILRFARVNKVTSSSLGYPLSVFNKNSTLMSMSQSTFRLFVLLLFSVLRVKNWNWNGNNQKKKSPYLYLFIEQIELQTKLLNYFLGSNKSNINQSQNFKVENTYRKNSTKMST